MKKLLERPTLVLFICLGVLGFVWYFILPWHEERTTNEFSENIGELEIGMNVEEVLNIMGQPNKKSDTVINGSFYYTVPYSSMIVEDFWILRFDQNKKLVEKHLAD